MKYTRIEEKGTTNTLLPQSEFYPMPEIEIYDSPEYFAITNKLSELKDPNDKKALRDNLDINWKNIQGDIALSTSLVNYINNPDNYWSTSVLNKVFKSFKTKAEFETNLGKGKINLNLIIFIEDTKDIWTQGVYYHCPKSYEELVELIEKVSSDHINVGIDVTALFTFNNVLYNKTISEIAKNFLYTVNNQNGVSSVVTFYANKINAKTGYLVLTNISSDNISYLTSTIVLVGSNIKCTKVEAGCKWLESLNESVLDDYLKTANLKRVSVKSDGLMPSTMLGNSVSYIDKLLYYYPISHNYLEKQLLIPFASSKTPGIMSIKDKELLEGLANYSNDLTEIKDLLKNSESGGNVDLVSLAERFLSKKDNDIAEGDLTFKGKSTFEGESSFAEDVKFTANTKFTETADFDKGIIIGSDFNSDSFAGTGGGFFVDDKNASQLVVDYATIRRKAIFNEIEIKSLKHVGGTMIISAASCKIDAVHPVTTSDNKIKYYCYFKKEDGEGNKAHNEWEVGDLARCLRFGILEGNSTNVETTYYWRKVTAINEVSASSNYSLDEYHEITLGDASNSLDDAPKDGDEIVLFGHTPQDGEPTTNNPRCSAILLSAYDVAIDDGNIIQSPCMILYADIINFDLKDTAKQIWSPGNNLFSGLIVVGPGSKGVDLFEGLEDLVDKKVGAKYNTEKPDNPKTGDIWFSDQGVLVYINGDWHPITDALLTNLQALLDLLQGKVTGTQETIDAFNARLDGKVTNWFFNGTPSLSKVPVSAWDTQYEEHIGDTFTSMTELHTNNNNRSWQWVRSEDKPSVESESKEDSAGKTYYYWKEITDSGMITALTAMAKENKAADGKCTVFLNERPLNYLKGDLWIVPENITLDNYYITEGTLLVAIKDYKDGFKREDWADKLSYPTLENISELYDEINVIIESVDGLDTRINALNSLIDGEIVSWFGTNTPNVTSNTYPLSVWDDLTLNTCKSHLNDTYTNTEDGTSWKWVMTQTKPNLDSYIEFLDNNKPVYFYWCVITDTAAQEALTQIGALESALDGRVRIFYNQPEPPYAEGDVWFNGKELKICTVKRDTGNYAEGDWAEADGYKQTIQSIVTESVQDINARLDGQIVTWYQDAKPSDSWKDDEERKNHIGDTWYDTGVQKTFIYKKKDDGTYDWEETNDPKIIDAIKDAKGIADGKRTTYVKSEPPTENLLYGDIWVLTAEWTDKDGIIKDEGTAYAEGTMFIYVESVGWTDLLKYADKSYVDTAVGNLSTNLQNLVDGKAEIWYQTDVPTFDSDKRKLHVNDFWIDPTSGITKVYVQSSENSYEWQETSAKLLEGLNQAVNGKTALYASWELVKNANYKIGDVWILSYNDINNDDVNNDGVKDCRLGFGPNQIKPPSWGRAGVTTNQTEFMAGIKAFSFYRATSNMGGSGYNPADWVKVANYSTEYDILKIEKSISDLQYKINTNVANINGQIEEYLKNDSTYKTLLEELQNDLNKAIGNIETLQDAQDKIPDLDALNNALREVEEITKDLEQAVTAALNDDLFNWKEIQEIQNLQNKLNEANDALNAMENKLQQLLQNEIAKLSFSPNNLLRNSGFEIPLSYLKLEINSDFKLNDNTLLSEGPLSYWDWLDVQIQSDAAFENYKSGSGYICQADTSNAYIAQNVSEVLEGETYILTFKGYSGKSDKDKFTITFGNQIIEHQCPSLQSVKLTFKLADKFESRTTPNLFEIKLPLGSYIFDLMLERGTIPSTQWSRNIQDSPVELAKLQSTLHIESAIAGYSDVSNGLILTNMLTLGDFPTKESLEPENASCGLNGKYSNKHNVAFWAGGNYENALNTANLMLGRPTYLPTAEELKNMASCIITHGGTAVLNEAIIRGSVYADRGYFKGSVYADSGYFKGTIEATDGVFENGYFDNVVISGTYNRRILHINKYNYKEFFFEDVVSDIEINLYPLLHTWGDVIYLDFAGLYENARTGAVTIKFPYYFPEADLGGVEYQKELGFIIKNGELNSATVEDVRSLLGKKIMIYTKNTPGDVLSIYCPYEDKTSGQSQWPNWSNTSNYYSGKVIQLAGSWNETKIVNKDKDEGDHGYSLNSNTLVLRSENCYVLECILTKRECHVKGSDNSTDSDDTHGWFEMLAWTSEELTAADNYIDNWYRCALYKYYESTGKSEFIGFMDAERDWTWYDAYNYDHGWSLGSFRIEEIEDNYVQVTLDEDSTTYYVCSDIQGTRVKPTDTLDNVYYLSEV